MKNLIKPVFKNLHNNLELKKQVEMTAKKEERKYLDKYYNDEIDRLRTMHRKNLDKAEMEANQRVRESEQKLKVEFRKEKEFLESEFKKDLEYKDIKIEELKTQIKTQQKSFEDKEATIYKEFEESKQKMREEFEFDKQRILDKFIEEIRDLRLRIEEKDTKLRKAQKGYFKYLKYAISAMHLIKEVRAEANLLMMSGVEHNQRMEKIHDKFESIDRFNEKTAPIIKDLLNYNRESDEELINDVLKDTPELADSIKLEIENELRDKYADTN